MAIYILNKIRIFRLHFQVGCQTHKNESLIPSSKRYFLRYDKEQIHI